MFDMVAALARTGDVDATYYSGYPEWKLKPPPQLVVRSFPLRTLITYGLLRVNERFRPSNNRLFAWQDKHFDRAVARNLGNHDLISALPGQCLHTFRTAKKKGIRTILNHASGPVRQQIRMVQPEYERAGIRMEALDDRFNDAYFAREAEEYALADYHCAASTIVRDQLIAEGVPAEKIWVTPYGADPDRFPKSLIPYTDGFRIIFAGQLGLRKGLIYLLKALEIVGDRPGWRLDCYGPSSRETEQDFHNYKGSIPVNRQGAISQEQLAQEFQNASVLVLPSVEEAFGLVVVQALQCGLPCIVSSAVGAKDLLHVDYGPNDKWRPIRQAQGLQGPARMNGSVFESGNSKALAEELLYWSENSLRVRETYDWSLPAQTFLEHLSVTTSIA